MDRPLDHGFRRKRLIRRIALAVVVFSALVGTLRWGAAALRPTVRADQIRTARVELGPVEATLTATGTVLPEIEQAVAAPVDARVLKILKRPGDEVSPGEPILDLDLTAAELEQQKLDQALALRANDQAKTRLELASRVRDLESQRSVKALQLAALKGQSARDRSLLKRGLLPREALDQSELQEAQAAAELERLAAEVEHARESTRVALRGLALEMATLARERDEAGRQLQRASTRADRPGVVTWTVAEEGAPVRKGEVIARVADLRSFRVAATISDAHAQRLAAGLPVIVKVSDTIAIAGTVTNVHPTIQDGLLTFAVALAERSHPALRSNLRVDVLVVTSRKDRALRVARGPSTEGTGVRDLFVVRNGRADRVRARLGMVGADHVELMEGLAEGDELIISDMSEFVHVPTIDLR